VRLGRRLFARYRCAGHFSHPTPPAGILAAALSKISAQLVEDQRAWIALQRQAHGSRLKLTLTNGQSVIRNLVEVRQDAIVLNQLDTNVKGLGTPILYFLWAGSQTCWTWVECG
jgi:hypothetical protein